MLDTFLTLVIFYSLKGLLTPSTRKQYLYPHGAIDKNLIKKYNEMVRE